LGCSYSVDIWRMGKPCNDSFSMGLTPIVIADCDNLSVSGQN
jgi:hypothetical protein